MAGGLNNSHNIAVFEALLHNCRDILSSILQTSSMMHNVIRRIISTYQKKYISQGHDVCLLFDMPKIIPFPLHSLPKARYFQRIRQKRLILLMQK